MPLEVQFIHFIHSAKQSSCLFTQTGCGQIHHVLRPSVVSVYFSVLLIFSFSHAKVQFPYTSTGALPSPSNHVSHFQQDYLRHSYNPKLPQRDIMMLNIKVSNGYKSLHHFNNKQALPPCSSPTYSADTYALLKQNTSSYMSFE